MKKLIISLVVIFSVFHIGCSAGGSGSSGNNIIISSNDSRSSGISDISRADITIESDGVQELSFISSSIFACNYDFSTGHWNNQTMTYPDGSTGPIEPDEIFLKAYVSFVRGEDHSFPLQEDPPNTIDLILFHNFVTMIKVDNQWYSDSDIDIEAVSVNNNDDDILKYRGMVVRQHYIDLNNNGVGDTSNQYERLTTMNVAFVNRKIIPESVLLDFRNYYNDYAAYKLDAERTHRPYVSEDEYTDYIGYVQGAEISLLPYVSENIFNEGQKILKEVSSRGSCIIIPFDGIEDLGDRDIVISLTLDNMIKKITDTQVVWNDRTSYGAPIDYSISFR